MTDITQQMREMARKKASGRRQQARSVAMKRKEEYLGARVPKELRDTVIRRADELGISVSILIRNILEAAFSGEVAGEKSVSTGKSQAFQNVSQSAGGAGSTKYSSVLGWEEIRLNKAINCSGCDTQLNAGENVTLGLGAPGEDHVILCDRCKETI